VELADAAGKLKVDPIKWEGPDGVKQCIVDTGNKTTVSALPGPNVGTLWEFVAPGEKPAPPVFVISPREGLALSREISGRGPTHIFGDSRASSPPPFKVHLKIEAAVAKPGRQGLVEGIIRGTTLHDQAIVLTANLQEGYSFANDDRSGCANLLEIARAERQ